MIYLPSGNQSSVVLAEQKYPEYKGRYTDGLDLAPDSELHRMLLSELFERVQESRNYMERRYGAWNSIDDTLRSYIDLTDEETDLQALDVNKPVSIVVPISFAIRETLLTQYVSTFFKPPIFRYRGVEGRDPLTAAKQEIIVDLQRYHSKVELSLYSMWSSFLSYGVAFGSPTWKKKYGTGTPRNPRSGEPVKMWEGNALNYISPYDSLPDVNKSVNQIQESEYFGRVRHTNLYELLAEERVDPNMFNCKYLHHMNRTSIFVPEADSAEDRPGEVWGSKPVDVIEKSVVLIPKMWSLGSSEYPEKWLFWIAGDGLIIRAEPLGLFYDEHPVVCGAPLFDDYTMTPISILERISGMQTFANWLINAYIIGTRRAMAINLVVDPSAINMDDLRSDEVVKLIRLNRSHWGKSKVSDYLQQLKIDNVTQDNIPGVSFLMDMVERVTGVTEAMQGLMRKGGERRSALEAQNSFSSAMSRVQKDAKLVSIQVHQDIARQFAYNNQQFLSTDLRLKITGDWQRRLEIEFGLDKDKFPVGSEFVITPEDFVDFDNNLISYDGSVPGDEDRNNWVQLVSPMFANPMIGAQLGLDMRRIFLHVARQLGATNVADFLLTPQKVRTESPDVVEEEVRKGNFAPVETKKDQFGLA